MKRKWLMVPLVTGILAAGLTGASVLAHNDGEEQESPKSKVAAKVAETLGLDEQTVIDALQSATQEVRLAQLQHRLDHLVESGRLTQEQANAYLDWYEARPEGPNIHRNGHRLFGLRGGGDSEANESGFRRGFDESGQRGQRFDQSGQKGQRFGESAQRGQRFGGQGFPGQGNRTSPFGQLPNGQAFPGQGEFPQGLTDALPQGNGASY